MRNLFLESEHFSLKNNIFYQKDLPTAATFERMYLSLREKENRVFPDEIVKFLPDVPNDHPLKKEWKMRKSTLNRLLHYFAAATRGKHSSILELGCGNGWLSSHLATNGNNEVIGMDINERELLQAARLFNDRKNLFFIYADIWTALLPKAGFDYIVLGSSIQYFPDLKNLVNKLLELARPLGQILILDTPIYASPSKAHEAKQRSFDYFQSIGSPEMSGHYFHHYVQELEGFNHTILFNPLSVTGFIRRILFNKRLPSFPIIQIRNS